MKYQLTCPKCKHEFQYDNGFFDKNISRLGVEIQDIILQLCEHKKLPKNEQYARTDWWLSAKRALAANVVPVSSTSGISGTSRKESTR